MRCAYLIECARDLTLQDIQLHLGLYDCCYHCFSRLSAFSPPSEYVLDGSLPPTYRTSFQDNGGNCNEEPSAASGFGGLGCVQNDLS